MSEVDIQLKNAVEEFKHYAGTETATLARRIISLRIEKIRSNNDTAPVAEVPLNQGEIRGLRYLLEKLS